MCVPGHPLCAQILLLKANGSFPDLCHQLKRFQVIMYNCANRYVPYDGEFMKTLQLINGATKLSNTVTDPTGCDLDNAHYTVPEKEVDYVCRSLFNPKMNAGFATSGAKGSQYAKVYLTGGYTNWTLSGDDAWYRGACPLVLLPPGTLTRCTNPLH